MGKGWVEGVNSCEVSKRKSDKKKRVNVESKE